MSLHDAGGGNKKVEPLKTSNTCINDVLLDELLVEILHRLPTKLAAQCKLVCKRWFSIVSSSCFLRCFIMRHDNEDTLHKEQFTAICSGRHLLITPRETGLKISLDFLPCFIGGQHLKDFRIVASCNDLLLCCVGLFNPSVYYVCNPFTKKWVEVPAHSGSCEFFGEIGFICDPYYHVDKQGVVINSNHSFKVIHVKRSQKPIYEVVVEIFSSEVGKWIGHIVSFPQGYSSTLGQLILSFGTKLYWPASDGIVIYDPNYEKNHSVVTYPIDKIQGLPIKLLGQCDGSLWIHQQDYWDLYIWQAKSQDNNLVNWSSKRRINLGDFIWSSFMVKARTRGMPRFLRPFAIHPRNPNILYFRCSPFTSYDFGLGYVASCDLKAETLKVVSDCPCYFGCMGLDIFILMRCCWPTPIPTMQ
ncbi:hypothetical protein Ancab_030250 [Ancistrocladus abbreviatus]